MTFTVSVLFAGLLYSASFVSAFSAKKAGSVPRACAGAGFAFHCVGLLAAIWATDSLPVGSFYGLVESISWIFVLTQLVVSKGFKAAPVGAFSMLPAAVLTLAPALFSVFGGNAGGPPGRSSNFAAVHGILAAVSYAFMMASAVAGLMYFQQKKFLREKSHNTVSRTLPPLEILENTMSGALGTSALLMFASAAVGTVSAFKVGVTQQILLKICIGIFILTLQAAAYFSAVAKVLGGARLAKIAIMLALAALLLLIPIEIVM